MRATTGVVRGREATGDRKAKVHIGWRITMQGDELCWLAEHDCGWSEVLTEWHNAFWAADHHVRYDCGRREQMSSGHEGTPDPWGLEPRIRPADETHEWDSCPLAYEEDVHAGHIYKRFDEQKVWCPGPVFKRVAYIEGGMQNDPRPSDMDFPLSSGSTEEPWVGAITQATRLEYGAYGVSGQGHARGGYAGGSRGYARGGWASGGCA